jgi:DNA-binding NtrC family response regulator
VAPIWIVSEDLRLARGLEPPLRACGEVVVGPPERAAWRGLDPPALVVWVLQETAPGELEEVERGLSFLSGIRRPRKPPVPVLYVAPGEGHPGADWVEPLIDDRPFAAIEWPPDPDRVTHLATELIDRPVRPPSLRTRARASWVRGRVERLYAGLDLPELRRAIDPRNARHPVLLVGETGTRRNLLARYIHELAEPVRDRFVRLGLDSIESGSLEDQVLRLTEGTYATLYVHRIGRASAAVQEELAELLTEGGGAALETVRWITAAERATSLARPLRLAPWIRVDLPSVRSRPDFDDLVVALVRDCSEQMGRSVEAGPEVLSMLASYPWPGNLRELEGVIHTSVANASGETLDPGDIVLDLVPPDRPEAIPIPPTEAAPEEPDATLPEETPLPATIDSEEEAVPEEAEAVPAEEPETAPPSGPPAVGPAETGASILGPFVEELKTPVRALRTLAGLLGQRPEDEETRLRLVEELEGDLGRMQGSLERVDRFLGFGRPDRKSVDVASMLDAALRRHVATVRERSLVVLQEPDEDSPPVQGDEEQLGFALDALLDRILRMVPTEGDLYVGTRHLDETADRPARHRVLIRFLSPEEVLAPPREAEAGGVPLEVLLARVLIERAGGSLEVDVSGPHDNIVLIELPA